MAQQAKEHLVGIIVAFSSRLNMLRSLGMPNMAVDNPELTVNTTADRFLCAKHPLQRAPIKRNPSRVFQTKSS